MEISSGPSSSPSSTSCTGRPGACTSRSQCAGEGSRAGTQWLLSGRWEATRWWSRRTPRRAAGPAQHATLGRGHDPRALSAQRHGRPGPRPGCRGHHDRSRVLYAPVTLTRAGRRCQVEHCCPMSAMKKSGATASNHWRRRPGRGALQPADRTAHSPLRAQVAGAGFGERPISRDFVSSRPSPEHCAPFATVPRENRLLSTPHRLEPIGRRKGVRIGGGEQDGRAACVRGPADKFRAAHRTGINTSVSSRSSGMPLSMMVSALCASFAFSTR